MFYVLVQGKGKKLQGSPSLVTTVGYSLHLGVVVVVVVVIGFVFSIFLSQNVTPLMNITLKVEVKYWIGGTTGETGFHSIFCAPFNPGGGSRKEILPGI